ncbi:hypothetical protein FXO37_03768 [Capsicum annuum]|nr:hypothetical protein FXO37_03768 [Capsicum annuum]
MGEIRSGDKSTFDTDMEAGMAYDAVAIEFRGVKAKTNFLIPVDLTRSPSEVPLDLTLGRSSYCLGRKFFSFQTQNNLATRDGAGGLDRGEMFHTNGVGSVIMGSDAGDLSESDSSSVVDFMGNDTKGIQINLNFPTLQSRNLTIPNWPSTISLVSYQADLLEASILAPELDVERYSPADKLENTTVTQIRQFSTGTVSISFQRSQSQRISGSSSVLPEIQTTRNSVSSFPSRIETINFESRFPQAKYSVETPPNDIHDDPPQSPTYSALGAELGVLSQDFHIDKKTLGTEFYSSGNILKQT